MIDRHLHERARGMLRLAGLALALVAAAAAPARAALRCSNELQVDVCLEADGVCPAWSGTPGPVEAEWPVFQHDAQHTGVSPLRGPTCGRVLWQAKVRGPVLSQPVVGKPLPGESDGVLYVASAKFPVCAFAPRDGSLLWCATDNRGKLPDRSTPAIGNEDSLYVGTRDNDMWAMKLPATVPGVPPEVLWRQKVCSDGDISTSAVVSPEGLVYMGSDSLSAGTIMAMCPGPERHLKWCHNPVGDGIKNVSPALDPTGTRLYVSAGGRDIIAYDASNGTEKWRVRLEERRNGLRGANYSPVVNPSTGRIYFGGDSGVFAIDPIVDPDTGAESAAVTLLSVPERGDVLTSPPVVDVARGRLYYGASRGFNGTLYAVDLATGVRAWRIEVPKSQMRNRPPVVDGDGNVYYVGRFAIHGLRPDGTEMWKVETADDFQSGPVLARARLYAATRQGNVVAIGGCP
jgi:outer membrane protein assembly factor BamB